ncbi:MAG TPA: xanthine dehydrogenase family protein molybdopterin-binding subunit [Cyclobacteriaceae bacterium]|nr:xanthine dehydrogenase family protein molybdopterin-binding subunit [Cyclobacteriaceae bacterium]
MTISTKTSRRNFIKLAATASGGLWLGFNWTSADASRIQAIHNVNATGAMAEFNGYLSIAPDGVITIFSPNPELGQNIKTTFPMIVADELDGDWGKVNVLQAPLDVSKFDRQVTGGSGAIPHSWERLRKAGATARYMLVEAAAKRWNIPSGELTTDKSFVIHAASGRRLSYGELASEAMSVPVPAEVKLKDPKDFKLIGKMIPNVDNHEMLTGKPLFGLDFYREGMLYAMIQRPQAFGMKIKSTDIAEAKAMPGIVDVVTFKDKVAIVGKSTWQVMKARKKMKIEYESEGKLESTEDHDRIFKTLLDGQEVSVKRKDGDVDAAFAKAAKVITREYQCPFLPHNTMEPMNFFAHVREDGVELIGPTQTPDRSRNDVAKLLGIAPEKITVNMTRLGGGFGRRLMTDYSVEAAELSSLIKAPVKVIWTREDDMTAGFYRPAVRYRFSAALDAKGNMIGYKLRGAGINAGNCTREDNFPSGAVENLLIESVEYKSPITSCPWRAPITNFLAFAEQSFLDEVADEAKQDPVQFRLALLQKAKESPTGEIKYDIDRMKGVIELVTEKANWGRKKNVSQGFSVYFSHRSYVAQVAEISKVQGKPVLEKIYAAADCGIVVNLSGSHQQVRGGIIDGLGHAMFGNLTFDAGAVQQNNFNNYRMIRFKETPEIEVHFADNGMSPTGLGEPALPPTGGSVANAIFKATGKRLYNQPFIKQEGMGEMNIGTKI